jgi:hypothetical protein
MAIVVALALLMAAPHTMIAIIRMIRIIAAATAFRFGGADPG